VVPENDPHPPLAAAPRRGAGEVSTRHCPHATPPQLPLAAAQGRGSVQRHPPGPQERAATSRSGAAPLRCSGWRWGPQALLNCSVTTGRARGKTWL
uniref:Uncharacterized protein n=1 Tax=Chrysemys picta bellii TaxID=8478 RepID=A0A8C3FBB6_CHRPI